jgi:hypothetical protein
VTEEDLENIIDEAGPDLLAQPPLIPAPTFTPAVGAAGVGSATSNSSWRRGSIRSNPVDLGLAAGGSSGDGGGGGGGGGGNDGGGRWRPAAEAAAAVSALRRATSRRLSAIGGSLTSAVLASAGGGPAININDEWPEVSDPVSGSARWSAAVPKQQRSGPATLTSGDGQRRLGLREFEWVLRQQMTLYIQAHIPWPLSCCLLFHPQPPPRSLPPLPPTCHISQSFPKRSKIIISAFHPK